MDTFPITLKTWDPKCQKLAMSDIDSLQSRRKKIRKRKRRATGAGPLAGRSHPEKSQK